jgi:hypothetical protein
MSDQIKLLVTLMPGIPPSTMVSFIHELQGRKQVEKVEVAPAVIVTPTDEIIATVRKKAEALQRVVDFAVTELSK